MPHSLIGEFFAYALAGIIEELKGKWFWVTATLILLIFIGLIVYFS